MHMDPSMPMLTLSVFAILALAFILKRWSMPYVVAYMLAGVLLGPHGFAIMTDMELIHRVGAFGVLFLLFFVGMEVSIPTLMASWRIPIFGTALQIACSVASVWLVGWWLLWPIERIVLMGFVISLSSTAVIITMLQERGELQSTVGQHATSILLAQDVALIPMMMCLSMLAGHGISVRELSLQVLGGAIIIGLVWLALRGTLQRWPWLARWRHEHELQVFAALLLCFGLAALTGWFGLSSALGAFVAGIIVAELRETEWVHRSLAPFHGVFVALFFVSIGLSVDLSFVARHAVVIGALCLAALLTNTFVNAAALRILRSSWRDSLYVGALLSQVGEFSFVLAAIGLQSQIITDYGYQLTIGTIFLTLLFSPTWIWLWKRLLRYDAGHT